MGKVGKFYLLLVVQLLEVWKRLLGLLLYIESRFELANFL